MDQTSYPSKSWFFKSRFPFKFRQHDQQQLYPQYKVIQSMLNSLIGTPSFSQPYLCIQPTLQYRLKIPSSTSVNFHLTISLLLVQKFIFTIPTKYPFLYTSAIFYHSLSAYNHSNLLCQKYLANSSCVKGPVS